MKNFESSSFFVSILTSFALQEKSISSLASHNGFVVTILLLNQHEVVIKSNAICSTLQRKLCWRETHSESSFTDLHSWLILTNLKRFWNLYSKKKHDTKIKNLLIHFLWRSINLIFHIMWDCIFKASQMFLKRKSSRHIVNFYSNIWKGLLAKKTIIA